MASEYVSYALIEMWLIALAYMIYKKSSDNIGSEYEVKRFKSIILSFEVTLCTDILWAFTEAQILQPPKLLNASINSISLCAVAVGCYYWFDYVLNRSRNEKFDYRLKHILLKLPLYITVSLNLLSIVTEWVFKIDENGHYTRGPLFPAQIFGTYFYLIGATIIALAKMYKSRSKTEKTEYFLYSLYLLPTLISGFLENYFPGTPILYMSMFSIIFFIFVTIQDSQIFTDALTGLNNRRRLEQYLPELQGSLQDNKAFFVFMIDVDHFKLINDVYGHIEGDFALKIVADTLKKTSQQLGGFTARYGGDEFFYVLSDKGINPDRIKSIIRTNLEDIRLQEQCDKTYPLSVSIGYSKFSNMSESDIFHALSHADDWLYNDKAKSTNNQ